MRISLRLMELPSQKTSPASLSLVEPAPSSLCSTESSSPIKGEVSGILAGLRRVKFFQRTKRCCPEVDAYSNTHSSRCEDSGMDISFDTDSTDEEEAGLRQSLDRLSFSYETLAHSNFTALLFYSNDVIESENENWMYHNFGAGTSSLHDDCSPSGSDLPLKPIPKRSFFPWRKRKLSFRSSKYADKGEPLLKKDHGEEGGDDIDYFRRQISACADTTFEQQQQLVAEESVTTGLSFTDFEADTFAVGNWEAKEITSRDGRFQLQVHIFFASIDQRSERAAGESACTALVAVIANWLHSNPQQMPNKSEFDSLIRDGSLEWRKLCDDEDFRHRFPDGHFDLETVLEAKIRNLLVVPERSFVGFFHPEGLEEADIEFLHGAMTFDNIWDEICRCGSSLYIVSWNDHFFLLKIETNAYYVIDTLGERLCEGCNEACILRFDKDSTVKAVSHEKQVLDPNSAGFQAAPGAGSEVGIPQEKRCNERQGEEHGQEIVCQGKESCKEYIKRFLSAIPVRQLQADLKRGLLASAPLHQRLQIEFHYTRLSNQESLL